MLRPVRPKCMVMFLLKIGRSNELLVSLEKKGEWGGGGALMVDKWNSR